MLAGHSRIETTMRYVHPDQEDVLDIAGAVESARARRKSPDVGSSYNFAYSGTVG